MERGRGEGKKEGGGAQVSIGDGREGGDVSLFKIIGEGVSGNLL